MTKKRTFGGVALLLALASAIGAQEPADPMAAMHARMGSMEQMMQHMHQMMMSMHGGMGAQGADGHDAQPGAGGMGMQAPGTMMGGQGMSMHGTGPDTGGVCLARGPDGALSALLLAPAGVLRLTDAQGIEIQAILARAQNDALAKLTPEQRARLETLGTWKGGTCTGPMGTGTPPN